MQKFLCLVLALSACGYSSVDNELTGQVKRVKKRTPMVCPDYVEVDVSLGIMRNGVGSMSTEDVWLLVESYADIALLEKAAEEGGVVKVHYDVKRLTLCVPDHRLTKVERLQ